jgi:hypothetical protein
MTKNLLVIAAALVTLGLGAQNKSIQGQYKQAIFPTAATSLPAAKTTTGQTCDSLMTMDYSATSTETITIHTAGTDSTVPTCTAHAGYVYGTNCYGDKEKAQLFTGSMYGSVPNLSVSAVKVMFWQGTGTLTGMGTQGAISASVGVKFYSGSTIASAPSGVGFGSTLVPVPVIVATSGGNSFWYYNFNFATPVQVPGSGFYASIVIPTTVGDTAVIAAQGTSTTNYVWEKFNDNSWHAVTETPASWGAPGNMVVIPKYCFDITTNVSKNLGISNSVDVYPVPSNGVVKIQTSFVDMQDLNVTVTNNLGQVVYSGKRTESVQLIDLDLSEQPNGVYFITVSNATDKMVTKMILSK